MNNVCPTGTINANQNENIIFPNSKENDKMREIQNLQNIRDKKIEVQNNFENDNIILESKSLIPEILKVYQKAKKFDYNFDAINMNFKDFVHNFSLANDENKNIENIPNNTYNINDNDNSNKKKSVNDCYSPFSQALNNSNSNNKNKNVNNNYIILENGTNQINRNEKCNCKNSNCLKLYCECFARGNYCQNCPCCNCQNKIEYESLRKEKYKNIISRNPKAILQINSTKKSWTCNCRNSNCNKKYCDCFHHGKKCTSKCKCINCLNKIIVMNDGTGKTKRVKRIRGAKKFMNPYLFVTPKKKSNTRRNNNQSTAEFTENNNNNKINLFKNASSINNNNIKNTKSINIKLNMDDL